MADPAVTLTRQALDDGFVTLDEWRPIEPLLTRESILSRVLDVFLQTHVADLDERILEQFTNYASQAHDTTIREKIGQLAARHKSAKYFYSRLVRFSGDGKLTLGETGALLRETFGNKNLRKDSEVFGPLTGLATFLREAPARGVSLDDPLQTALVSAFATHPRNILNEALIRGSTPAQPAVVAPAPPPPASPATPPAPATPAPATLPGAGGVGPIADESGHQWVQSALGQVMFVAKRIFESALKKVPNGPLATLRLQVSIRVDVGSDGKVKKVKISPLSSVPSVAREAVNCFLGDVQLSLYKLTFSRPPPEKRTHTWTLSVRNLVFLSQE